MDSTRQNKISRLLQRELSEILMREGRQWTLGAMVSVSKVRISPDLALARAYISIFPSERQAEVHKEITENISGMRRFLGMRVGKQVRIVPHLQFFVDDSLDYIENIDRLLKDS